jgi:hypothetical protein
MTMSAFFAGLSSVSLFSKSSNCVMTASILPNTFYTITFHPENKLWDGTGNSGDGNTCKLAVPDRSVIGGYGCSVGNNGGGAFCEDRYTPSGGAFVLWGETFRFDETGQVIHEKTGAPAGILLRQIN